MNKILLHYPTSVFVSNGEIFIADSGNHRVRKLLRNGHIVTIAGTGVKGYNGDGILATDAQLYLPSSVFVSSSNQVYISEDLGQRIRKIDQFGIISTIAGTGEFGYNGDDQLAVNAQLNDPCGLFVTDEEEVLFCDYENYRVRKIDRHGMIRTIAGNGDEDGTSTFATSTSLKPTSVFVHKNEIYVVDYLHSQIRKIDKNGIISTIAGTGRKGYNGDDILATSADIYIPVSVFVYNDEIYFTERESKRVRKIDRNGIISTIAGNGKGGKSGDGELAINAKLIYVQGLSVTEESVIFVDNDRIRKINQHSGIISTIVGTDNAGYSGDVEFDFQRYPHIGPKKKTTIKPFTYHYHDLVVKCLSLDSHYNYEPNRKKIKQ